MYFQTGRVQTSATDTDVCPVVQLLYQLLNFLYRCRKISVTKYSQLTHRLQHSSSDRRAFAQVFPKFDDPDFWRIMTGNPNCVIARSVIDDDNLPRVRV